MLALHRLLLSTLLLVPALPAGHAQQSGALAAAGARGAQLVPGTWTYDIIARVDSEEQKIGTRALVIEATTLEGRPAWLIAESSWTSGATMTDSLHVERESFRPMRRSLALGDARLSADFTADSARGSIRTSAGSSSFATALPAGSVISSGMLEALLRISALEAGWRARADLLVIGSAGRTHANPTMFAITGSERVSVPGGSFETWTATSTASDGKTQRLWLSKEGGWVVRSVAPIAELPGAIVETVLVGHATAPR